MTCLRHFRLNIFRENRPLRTAVSEQSHCERTYALNFSTFHFCRESDAPYMILYHADCRLGTHRRPRGAFGPLKARPTPRTGGNLFLSVLIVNIYSFDRPTCALSGQEELRPRNRNGIETVPFRAKNTDAEAGPALLFPGRSGMHTH